MHKYNLKNKIVALVTLIIVIFGIVPAVLTAGVYTADVNNDYVFSIYGEDGTYTLLDGDEENGYFVIANDYYDTYSYGDVAYSFTDTTSIGYWLNNGFITSDNTLSKNILDYVDYNHQWDEGTAGISLLSSAELESYIDRIGFNADFGKTSADASLTDYKYWWLRTESSTNSNRVEVCSGVSSITPRKTTLIKTAKAMVRPVFYLKADFFENVKLNTFYIGKGVKEIIAGLDTSLCGYSSTENNIISDTVNNTVIKFSANIMPDDSYITDEPYVEITVNADATVTDGYKVVVTSDAMNKITEKIDFSQSLSKSKKIYLDSEEGEHKFNISLYNGDSLIKSLSETVTILENVENSGYRDSGYNTHIAYSCYDVDTTVELLDTLGVTLVRDHALWSSVETKAGEYVWSDKFISYVNKLDECGIEMLYILTTNNPLYGDSWNGMLDTPEEIAGFTNYAVATAKAFPQIKKFEILNEANVKYTPEQYYALTSAVSKALKEYDPTLEVITGAIADSHPSPVVPWEDFAAGFVDTDTYMNIDALSYHSYNEMYYADSKSYEDSYIVLRDSLRSYGGWKDLQVTETGYGTGIFYYDDEAAYDEAEKADMQANEIVKRNVVNDDLGIALTANFVLLEELSDGDAEYKWGIVKDDGTPKKAYYSVKNFYKKTQNAVFMGEVLIDEEIKAYWYRNNGENTVVMWQVNDSANQRTSRANSQTATVSIESGAVVTDIYGDVINHSGTITVSTDVLYADGLSDEYLKSAYSKTALSRISEETDYLNSTLVNENCALYPELCENPDIAGVTELLKNLYECGNIAIANQASNNRTDVELSTRLSELYKICDEVSKLYVFCDGSVDYEVVENVKDSYTAFEKTAADIGNVLYKDEAYKTGKRILDKTAEYGTDDLTAKSQTEHSYVDSKGNVTISGEGMAERDVTIKVYNDNTIAYIGYVTSDENGKYSLETSFDEYGTYNLVINDGTVYNETISYLKDMGQSEGKKYAYAKAVVAGHLLDWSKTWMADEIEGNKALRLDDFEIVRGENGAEFSFTYNHKNSGTNKNVLVVAAYDNGQYIDSCIYYPVEGDNPIENTIKCGDGETEIKVMLLDSWETMIPLKDYFHTTI